TGKVITEIYRDISRDFQSIISSLQSAQENSLMHIAHAMKKSLKNDLFTIFNPLAWKRHGYFFLHARSFGHVLDPSDNPMFIQRVNHTHFIPNSELQLGLEQIRESEYLTNIESKIQDIEELEGMNLTFNSTGLKTSLKTAHAQMEKYENRSSELLLVYLSAKEALKSYGIANISCVRAIPPPPRDYSYITKTPKYFIFSNQHICTKISKTTGLLEFIGNFPTSPNFLRELGINYKVYKRKFGLEKYIPQKHTSIVDLGQKRTSIRVEIEEEGPLRFTFISKYGPFTDGTEVHTRYSFFHKSSRICIQTIVNWKTPNAQLEVEIPFAPKIGLIHVKNTFGFSTEKLLCRDSLGMNNSDKRGNSDNLNIPGDLEEKTVKNSEIILFETIRNNEYPLDDIPTTLALYGQISHSINISSRDVHFSLLHSTPVSRPDLKCATLDADYKQQYSHHEIGFHNFNWVLEPYFEQKSPLVLYRGSQEMRFPILVVPTNANHGHESLIQISPDHVEVLAIKEIEEYMREAPDWFYKPSMAELPFVIRCRELLGQKTTVEIILHPRFEIKKVMEVDTFEHISQPNIVPEPLEHQSNKVTFPLKAHQMKTIMFIAKVPLEEE
ncbi:MAG: hypothetical protein ACTSVZ_11160, partial [Promethearchaeota archaeon]